MRITEYSRDPLCLYSIDAFAKARRFDSKTAHMGQIMGPEEPVLACNRHLDVQPNVVLCGGPPHGK